jgi:hypothetical protein
MKHHTETGQQKLPKALAKWTDLEATKLKTAVLRNVQVGENHVE